MREREEGTIRGVAHRGKAGTARGDERKKPVKWLKFVLLTSAHPP